MEDHIYTTEQAAEAWKLAEPMPEVDSSDEPRLILAAGAWLRGEGHVVAPLEEARGLTEDGVATGRPGFRAEAGALHQVARRVLLAPCAL